MEDEDERFWRRGGGPRLGESLINTRTGELQDYYRYPGDEPPSRFGTQDQSDRWGRRILMQINQPIGAKTAARDVDTLVDIRTLEKTVPIDLQIRFARVAPDGTPILPFSPVWPNSVGERMTITVRRTGDPLSAMTEDVFQMSGSEGDSPVFQWDIFTSRTFSAEAAFDNFVSPLAPSQIWVEAIATQVADVGTRNRIEGWAVTNDSHFQAAVASPASVNLLGVRSDRRQFIVCNLSTNADLWLGFGIPVNPSVPAGTMVLPPGTTYESPVGGFVGLVSASWNNAAPDGGALVTEGVFGAPGRISG